jgi:hypothetical protein
MCNINMKFSSSLHNLCKGVYIKMELHAYIPHKKQVKFEFGHGRIVLENKNLLSARIWLMVYWFTIERKKDSAFALQLL